MMQRIKQNLPNSMLERCYRFTVVEIESLCQANTIQRNQVELMDGFLLDKVVTNLQFDWSVQLHEQLLMVLQQHAIISRLTELVLSKNTSLLPDFTIIPLERYTGNVPNPDEAVLLIEISDTTLENDKGIKLQRYAQAGIKEYWVIDAKAARLEVYREPEGLEYRSKMTLSKGNTATMLEFPDVQLKWWI